MRHARATHGGVTPSERRATELRRARSALFWKTFVAASAAVALSVALVTSLRDREHANDRERGRVELTGAFSAGPAAVPVEAEPAEDAAGAGATILPSGGAASQQPEAAMAMSSSAAADAGDASALAPVLAAPTVDGSLDAGVATAAAIGTEAAGTAPRAGADAADAGPPAPDPWAPPPMSAGAGRFVTERNLPAYGVWPYASLFIVAPR